MGRIDYKSIYNKNRTDWKAMTEEPYRYEALLAGHYSDSNHFVYELLQNAEDEQASIVVIEYTDKGLIFYHNGNPFTQEDVVGISSMLMGKKQIDTIDKDSAQTIGHFGMGFKSVYKYTCLPQIFSDDEQFQIKNYLLPEETSYPWDYKATIKGLNYPLSGQKQYFPFKDEDHLTRIVIPFAKRTKDGKAEPISGKDVLIKLKELDGEILLFLTHIRELFWIDRTSGEKTRITLEQKDNEYTCRIEGTNYAEGENFSRYLKFKRVFDHPEMKYAEVSVAYSVNPRSNTVNVLDESPIWVYFPTRDETNLPFLIHGSFETAVSREKLMCPSDFNEALFDVLGDLIADSMQYLAEHNMISQTFIRRILIPAFQDEEENETIPGLKEKVTQAFQEHVYLQDINGKYKKPEELIVAVPFRMSDFKNTALFRSSFPGDKELVQFSNEREPGFTEYFVWMTEDLGVGIFSLSDWAKALEKEEVRKLNDFNNGFDDLKHFYDVISDFRAAVYGVGYSRGGEYSNTLKNAIDTAWEYFKEAPIVLNAEDNLVPAYVDGKPTIYMNASSKYKRIPPASVVNDKIADGKLNSLLRDGFQIPDFDNLQYVKEKVIKKYVEGDKINFNDDDHFEKEYIEDLQQIISLMKEEQDEEEIKELLSKASIIKIEPKDGESGATFSLPQEVYIDKSTEGIDLVTFYAVIADDVDYQEERYHIDRVFYEEHEIEPDDLVRLGVINSPVNEGIKFSNGRGDSYWRATGTYCPLLEIDGLDENLEFIENYADEDEDEEELARKKSAELLKLLLLISDKLTGFRYIRKTSPYKSAMEEVRWLSHIRWTSWLFDRTGNLVSPGDISKYDLDEGLYGVVTDDDQAYSLFGFAVTEDDTKADTFKMVHSLEKDDQKNLLEQLARSLGYSLTKRDEDDDDEDEGGEFDPSSWMSEAFPVHRVRNMDSLVKHVREQFFCTSPQKYEQVLRRIRTSTPEKERRAYVRAMYTNEDNFIVCQMCKSITQNVEAIEIANYGIEMPQVGLCLCPNCAAQYNKIKIKNKEQFKNQMKAAINDLDVEEYEEDLYTITLDAKHEVNFTATHLAEIQEIFRLIDEFGLPSEDSKHVDDKTASKAEARNDSHPNTEIDYDDIKKQLDNIVDEFKTKTKGTVDHARQPNIVTVTRNRNAQDGSPAGILKRIKVYSGNGVTVAYDEKFNSIEIMFDYYISADIKNTLVSNRWKWHKVNQYWFKWLNDENARFALQLAGYDISETNKGLPDSDERIKKGDIVTYKDLSKGTCHEIQIDDAKYSLHKLFLGKTEGDIISFPGGKRHEIVSVTHGLNFI